MPKPATQGGLARVKTRVRHIENSSFALTDGATISLDLSNGDFYTVTLTDNRTLANPTNATTGRVITFIVTQDGTGSRTLAYGSNFRFPGSVEPVLSTGAADIDILQFFSDGTNMWLINAIFDLQA